MSVDVDLTDDDSNQLQHAKTAASLAIEEARFFLMPVQQNLKHYTHEKGPLLTPKPS